jgi:ThiF family protein
MGRAKLTNTDHAKQWPKVLQDAATKAALTDAGFAPVVLRMHEKGAAARLEKLATTSPITLVKDTYDEQLAELLLSRNAQLYRANPAVQQESIASFLASHYGTTEPWQMGSWVYYPWSGYLVHILEEELFLESRTIRNKNLITADEQATYADFKVGCLGMSVGSSAAVALILQGGSRQIAIADSAVISGSNLNRIRTGVSSVGDEKATVIARQLYEMDPYIAVAKASGQVTQATLESFFTTPQPLQCVVDEIDDLEVKVRLRVEARRRGIPVLMATDLGDDVMLDVERFDRNPNLALFHGLAGDIEAVLTKKDMTQRQWLKYANMIIGNQNVPLRLQQSLLQIGQTLPTQPQLGGTAQAAGSVIAYAVRMLALGQPLKSGRTMISLDHHLLEGHRSARNRLRHRRHTQILKKALDSI